MQNLSLFGDVPATICHRGRTYINPAKLHQKLFFLRSDTAVVPANGDLIVAMTPPRDRGDEGDAELHYFTSESTGAYAVRLYSDRMDRFLMNRPVESTLLFGSSSLPGRLHESVFVPSASSIRTELTDLSGAPNTVSIVGIGNQLLLPRTPVERQVIGQKPFQHVFWLTFDDGPQVTLAAGTTSTFTMTIPGDAHFNAWAMLARSTGDFDIEIVEGQRRSLMSTGAVMPVNLITAQTLTVAGFPGGIIPAASLPMVFPWDHLFEAKTAITIRLTDTSGAPNTISAAMHGQLLYYDRAPSGITHRTAQPG